MDDDENRTADENYPEHRYPRGLKALGTNQRALGTNPRARAENKWALRNWKRRQQQKVR